MQNLNPENEPNTQNLQIGNQSKLKRSHEIFQSRQASDWNEYQKFITHSLPHYHNSKNPPDSPHSGYAYLKPNAPKTNPNEPDYDSLQLDPENCPDEIIIGPEYEITYDLKPGQNPNTKESENHFHNSPVLPPQNPYKESTSYSEYDYYDDTVDTSENPYHNPGNHYIEKPEKYDEPEYYYTEEKYDYPTEDDKNQPPEKTAEPDYYRKPENIRTDYDNTKPTDKSLKKDDLDPDYYDYYIINEKEFKALQDKDCPEDEKKTEQEPEQEKSEEAIEISTEKSTVIEWDPSVIRNPHSNSETTKPPPLGILKQPVPPTKVADYSPPPPASNLYHSIPKGPTVSPRRWTPRYPVVHEWRPPYAYYVPEHNQFHTGSGTPKPLVVVVEKYEPHHYHHEKLHGIHGNFHDRKLSIPNDIKGVTIKSKNSRIQQLPLDDASIKDQNELLGRSESQNPNAGNSRIPIKSERSKFAEQRNHIYQSRTKEPNHVSEHERKDFQNFEDEAMDKKTENAKSNRDGKTVFIPVRSGNNERFLRKNGTRTARRRFRPGQKIRRVRIRDKNQAQGRRLLVVKKTGNERKNSKDSVTDKCDYPQGDKNGICQEYFMCSTLYTNSSGKISLQDYQCELPNKQVGICCPQVADESLPAEKGKKLGKTHSFKKALMLFSFTFSEKSFKMFENGDDPINSRLRNLIRSNIANSISFGEKWVQEMEKIEDRLLSQSMQVKKNTPAFGHNNFFPVNKLMIH